MITDTHGRSYIDMLCALGAVTLGYRQSGYSGPGVCALPHRMEIEAAELVLEHVAPWASWVRFVKAGSEATHAAYRIAKAVTRSSITLVGHWAHHGWHEWAATHPTRFAHGADLEGLYGDMGHSIAAVFIEPHRWEHVDREWLRS